MIVCCCYILLWQFVSIGRYKICCCRLAFYITFWRRTCLDCMSWTEYYYSTDKYWHYCYIIRMCTFSYPTTTPWTVCSIKCIVAHSWCSKYVGEIILGFVLCIYQNEYAKLSQPINTNINNYIHCPSIRLYIKRYGMPCCKSILIIAIISIL